MHKRWLVKQVNIRIANCYPVWVLWFWETQVILERMRLLRFFCGHVILTVLPIFPTLRNYRKTQMNRCSSCNSFKTQQIMASKVFAYFSQIAFVINFCYNIPFKICVYLFSWNIYYRPQRSCECYVFTPVCHSVHGGSASVHAGIPSPWETHPPEAHHSGKQPQEVHPHPQKHPPGSTPPESTHPHGKHIPLGNTPLASTPPGKLSPWDGCHCGWYTSYWNAFLLYILLHILYSCF